MKNLILILCFLLVSCDSSLKITDTENTNFKWELIKAGRNEPDFYRARIYGGWLVTKWGTDNGITFIPLQNPDGWEIKPLNNQNKAK